MTIDAPPMNMLGPEMVRDLVSLIQMLDTGEPYRVVVFRSADPDYFISHVDVTKIAAYRAEALRQPDIVIDDEDRRLLERPGYRPHASMLLTEEG